jgi:hypothetical protein
MNVLHFDNLMSCLTNFLVENSLSIRCHIPREDLTMLKAAQDIATGLRAMKKFISTQLKLKIRWIFQKFQKFDFKHEELLIFLSSANLPSFITSTILIFFRHASREV